MNLDTSAKKNTQSQAGRITTQLSGLHKQLVARKILNSETPTEKAKSFCATGTETIIRHPHQCEKWDKPSYLMRILLPLIRITCWRKSYRSNVPKNKNLSSISICIERKNQILLTWEFSNYLTTGTIITTNKNSYPRKSSIITKEPHKLNLMRRKKELQRHHLRPQLLNTRTNLKKKS